MVLEETLHFLDILAECSILLQRVNKEYAFCETTGHLELVQKGHKVKKSQIENHNLD